MPPGITIVGLGSGDPSRFTRQVWETLAQAGELHLSFKGELLEERLPSSWALSLIEEVVDEQPFANDAGQALAEHLVELGRRPQGVVWGVPGDPAQDEPELGNLRRHAETEGLPVSVLSGISLAAAALNAADMSTPQGLFAVDARRLAGCHHPPFPPDKPAVIVRLTDSGLAARVHSVLLNQYPASHRILLVRSAGVSAPAVDTLTIEGLGQADSLNAFAAVLVPELEQAGAFETFQNTVARLRAPGGCPWDQEQTHQSLRAHLMQEAYEALAAIDTGDMAGLEEELGDLLLQLVMQAQIATEEGVFRMADVIGGINTKLIRRHPHVFGEVEVEGVAEVLHNWEALKEAEREKAGNGRGALDGVPVSLPSLAQSDELQARAARVGFDWPQITGVKEKIAEEIGEVEAAQNPIEREAEFGDLLFALVNLARWMEVDPESALRAANQRFRRRFAGVEARARDLGRKMADMNIDELEALWQAAKAEERK